MQDYLTLTAMHGYIGISSNGDNTTCKVFCWTCDTFITFLFYGLKKKKEKSTNKTS